VVATEHTHPASVGHEHVRPLGPDADGRRLAAALGVIVAFMAGEVVAGILAHSLALLADAAHMLSDAGALGFSIVAMRLAARPPRGGFTFGYKRAEILSALGNGLALLVFAAVILVEAAHRLVSPGPVVARTVLGVALAGIGVNLLATWQVARADRRSLNVEGSFQHIVTDLYAFAGTAVAAVVMLLSGFVRADSIASLGVAALMLRAAYGLIRKAGRALLEAAPAGVDPNAIGSALAGHAHVDNVHDLHVWEITSGFPALSAHVLVHPGDDCHAIRLELEAFLAQRFGIEHTTLQVDHSTDPAVRWMERGQLSTGPSDHHHRRG
jgi:cobalt-zinc-cadmium efflux system protein